MITRGTPFDQETAIFFLTRKGDDQPLDFGVSLQVYIIALLKTPKRNMSCRWLFFCSLNHLGKSGTTSTYDEHMGKIGQIHHLFGAHQIGFLMPFTPNHLVRSVYLHRINVCPIALGQDANDYASLYGFCMLLQ